MKQREKKTLWDILHMKFVIIVAAGAMAYCLLGWFLRPPLPFGLHLGLQYAALGFFAVVYGPVVGLLVGMLGELALAFIGSGIWWSVVAASAFAGFLTGFLAHGKFRREGGFGGGAASRYIFGSLLAHGVAWVVVCSALDMLFYREALDNLLQRGLAATVSNAACAIIGGWLLLVLFGRLAPWQDRRRRCPEEHYYGDDFSGGAQDDLFDNYDEADSYGM